MSVSNLVDLTQTIVHGTLSPKEPNVEFRTIADYSQDAPYRMMWMGLTDHVGTHIDAPSHFVPGADSIDEADLARLVAMPGIFLDLAANTPFQKIDLNDIEKELNGYEEIPENAFVMVHTGSAWYHTPQTYFDSPWLTLAAAERIIALSPAAVGVNGPTVDDRRQPGRPIHKAFLSNGIHIIEGIVHSEKLAGKRFRCTALPLKLKGFTGSPIRLVACTD